MKCIEVSKAINFLIVDIYTYEKNCVWTKIIFLGNSRTVGYTLRRRKSQHNIK